MAVVYYVTRRSIVLFEDEFFNDSNFVALYLTKHTLAKNN